MPLRASIPTDYLRLAFAFLTLLFLAGCQSGPSGMHIRSVNAQLAANRYDVAEELLLEAKEREYSKSNMVLYYLNLGTVLHHAGRYKESDQAFEKAEQRMEELYTTSLTRTAGMLLINDTTEEYAGEPYERTLTNVYRALNWLYMKKPDEALVESRKVESFLEELNSKLQYKNTYKDDAFARYLDSLLYEDAGKADDARISMEKAMEAYSWYSSSYGTRPPLFRLEEDNDAECGELVFLHFNGVAPLKTSRSWQVAWNEALAMVRESNDSEAAGSQFRNGLNAGITGKAITISYPDYQPQPFEIQQSEIEVDQGTARASTIVVEDIQAIAARTLQDRLDLIKVRAVARATVKFVLAEAASLAAANECRKHYPEGWQFQLCKQLSSGLSHGLAAATEVADTRAWGTLPAQIRLARVMLPAGKHTVKVNFRNASGMIVANQVFRDVTIEKGKRTYLGHRTAM
jgi:uncharacterized protein